MKRRRGPAVKTQDHQELSRPRRGRSLAVRAVVFLALLVAGLVAGGVTSAVDLAVAQVTDTGTVPPPPPDPEPAPDPAPAPDPGGWRKRRLWVGLGRFASAHDYAEHRSDRKYPEHRERDPDSN